MTLLFSFAQVVPCLLKDICPGAHVVMPFAEVLICITVGYSMRNYGNVSRAAF